MLRSSRLLLVKPSRLRRCLNATSKQKRALDQAQLQGTAAAVTSSPPDSSSSPLPLLVGAVALAGGGYWAYTTQYAAPVAEEVGAVEDKQEAATTVDRETETAAAPTTTPSTATKESPAQHRVVSIAVPSKMKNASPAAAAITPPPHPTDGHRVGLPSRAPNSQPIDDTSVTERSLANLQSSLTEQAAEALVQSHQSTWSSLLHPLQDLESLSQAQLQARLVQLAAELQDRTKWEAVRLKEFLAMKDKETTDK